MEGEENGGRRKGKMEEGEDGVRSEWREGRAKNEESGGRGVLRKDRTKGEEN